MQTVIMGYCVSSQCASPHDIYYVLYTCSHHKCLLHREKQLMPSMCGVVMDRECPPPLACSDDEQHLLRDMECSYNRDSSQLSQ